MNTGLRPLIFIPRYWPHMGGAEIHTRRLVRELRTHCLPSIACIGTEQDGEIDRVYATGQTTSYRDSGTSITQLRADGLGRIGLTALSTLWQTGRLARGAYRKLAAHQLTSQLKTVAIGHDLVHAVYNGFTAGAEAASRLQMPFVWTPLVHAEHAAGTAWSSPQFLKLYQRADALIAMTEFERDWLIRHGAAKDCVHVCPAAPMHAQSGSSGRFRTQFDLDESPVVLFLGRLVSSKGFQFLLEASAEIWNHNPETKIVLVGDIDTAAKAVLADFQDSRIIATGRLPDGERDDALAACNMVCVPSDQESLGVIYLEAWAQGKPVIAADIEVLRTVIDNGKTGLLVQRNASEIAAAIQKLLDNPELAQRLGNNGKKCVERQYSWPGTAQKVHDIYRRIVHIS